MEGRYITLFSGSAIIRSLQGHDQVFQYYDLTRPFRTYILLSMPRAPKFNDDQILAATGRLIAAHGPSGATIEAIARAVGAPTGSIYHRFDSRDVLLAEVWVRAAAAFQAAFFARLAGSPSREAGLAAALYMAQRVRENPHEARLLLLHRREDFVDRGWPVAMRRRAEQLGRQVETELRAFSRRLCGREDARTVRIITYAVLDAPFAAVRRHVAANESPPLYVDGLVRITYEAVIGWIDVSGSVGRDRATADSDQRDSE
jgi:AcrR family transcriptional regulator